MGITLLQHYSDSEQLDNIKEADLEAEVSRYVMAVKLIITMCFQQIEQVMNMKRASSIENLYPPSYGSRASSSLSMGSSSVYHQSFSSNAAKPHPDSPNMYSSLPVVFRLTSYDKNTRPTPNSVGSSEEKFVASDSLNDRNNWLLSDELSGHRRPHYCTPSRRKKQERILKNIQAQKSPVLDRALFRSSSDGFKKKIFGNSKSLMNTHTMQLDDMPPLVPSFETAVAFDDSNSEASLTPIASEKASAKQIESFQGESSFEYSEPVSSQILTKSDLTCVDDAEDFNFPSPPPIPATQPSETPTSIESSPPPIPATQSSEAPTSIESSQEQIKVCQAGEEQGTVQEEGLPKAEMGGIITRDSEEEQQDENRQLDSLKTDVVQEELPCKSSEANEIYRGSVGKLSRMFGPEFNTLSGFHVGDKKASLKMFVVAVIIRFCFCS